MSDHNSRTHLPICHKFWLGTSVENRWRYRIFSFEKLIISYLGFSVKLYLGSAKRQNSQNWSQNNDIFSILVIPGMKPCGLNCPTCSYIEPGTVIQSSNISKKIEINGTFNCKTGNAVYCITCEQCKLQYIGQTTRSLDERVREHISYIRNLRTNQPTGEHFNFPGHEPD